MKKMFGKINNEIYFFINYIFTKVITYYIFIFMFISFFILSYISFTGNFDNDIYLWLVFPNIIWLVLFTCYTRSVFKLNKTVIRYPKIGDVLYITHNIKEVKNGRFVKSKIPKKDTNYYINTLNNIYFFKKGDSIKIHDVQSNNYGWMILAYKNDNLMFQIEYLKIHKYLKSKSDIRKDKLKKIGI